MAGTRQDADHVHTRWKYGGILSRGDKGQCNAASRSRVVESSRNGAAWSTFVDRLRTPLTIPSAGEPYSGDPRLRFEGGSVITQ